MSKVQDIIKLYKLYEKKVYHFDLMMNKKNIPHYISTSNFYEIIAVILKHELIEKEILKQFFYNPFIYFFEGSLKCVEAPNYKDKVNIKKYMKHFTCNEIINDMYEKFIEKD